MSKMIYFTFFKINNLKNYNNLCEKIKTYLDQIFNPCKKMSQSLKSVNLYYFLAKYFNGAEKL